MSHRGHLPPPSNASLCSCLPLPAVVWCSQVRASQFQDKAEALQLQLRAATEQAAPDGVHDLQQALNAAVEHAEGLEQQVRRALRPVLRRPPQHVFEAVQGCSFASQRSISGGLGGGSDSPLHPPHPFGPPPPLK